MGLVPITNLAITSFLLYAVAFLLHPVRVTACDPTRCCGVSSITYEPHLHPEAGVHARPLTPPHSRLHRASFHPLRELLEFLPPI